LRAKVRDALAAWQRMNATAEMEKPEAAPSSDREQRRRDLQTLDRGALAEAARADEVRGAFTIRPMTIEDVARLGQPRL
jgi:hypothetical protein